MRRLALCLFALVSVLGLTASPAHATHPQFWYTARAVVFWSSQPVANGTYSAWGVYPPGIAGVPQGTMVAQATPGLCSASPGPSFCLSYSSAVIVNTIGIAVVAQVTGSFPFSAWVVHQVIRSDGYVVCQTIDATATPKTTYAVNQVCND